MLVGGSQSSLEKVSDEHFVPLRHGRRQRNVDPAGNSRAFRRSDRGELEASLAEVRRADLRHIARYEIS